MIIPYQTSTVLFYLLSCPSFSTVNTQHGLIIIDIDINELLWFYVINPTTHYSDDPSFRPHIHFNIFITYEHFLTTNKTLMFIHTCKDTYIVLHTCTCIVSKESIVAKLISISVVFIGKRQICISTRPTRVVTFK